ncbi:MAG: PGPGW domain-containing protein [Acidimicrobiia bacterium]
MDREMIDSRIRRPLIVRVVLVMVGTILLVGGLIGLLLPVVPGWLMIIPGLAILGTEFVWARRLLDSAKSKASELRSKVPVGKKNSKVA